MDPARVFQWLAGKSLTQWAQWVTFNVTLTTLALSAARAFLRRTIPAPMRDRVAHAVPWLNRALDAIEALGASVLQLAAAVRTPPAPTPVVHDSRPGESGR